MGRKWFEVKIFTSNHFQIHMQREREWEIEPKVQSPSTSHPSTLLFDFDFESHLDRTLRLHRQTQSLDHAFNFVEMAPRWHRSHWSHWDRNWEMVGFWWIWPDLMNFFLLGFVSVFIYWEMVLYICLEAEKNVRNKKKMCFLYYFQQHNQTLENIFQRIFWNATKHLKIFFFPENSISGKYFTWTKHSLSNN